MDMNRLDLNLLRIFDSVYRLRNLAEVSNEVHLSQPAISHALGRLREAIGDRLFIRSANGLEPTARSEQLALPIRTALETIEDSLLGSEEFKPEYCTREFRLLLSDVGEMLFIPELMGYLRNFAPRAKLTVVQAARVHYDRMLRDREVDIAIGHLSMAGSNFKEESLFRDRCVVLRQQTAEGEQHGQLSKEEFERSLHVVINPPEDPVEEMFSDLNIVRNVSLRMPNYFALPSVIASSDLLATVPSKIALYLRKHSSFEIYELPFSSPIFDVKMCWHIRHDSDAAHVWLRSIFLSLFQRDISVERESSD